MSEGADGISNPASRRPAVRPGLAVLLGLHIVVCCLSLIQVARFYPKPQIVLFDTVHLSAAVANVVLFATVSVLFILARFSFGYFLGFYFYTMILGYIWLVEFSKLHYDHTTAAISAVASAIAFLVPALFITSPVRQRFVPSARTFDRLLSLILILAAVTVAVGSLYNFRLVGLGEIYDFRAEIAFPAWLRYSIGATSSALLPFAFACFAMHGNRWRAAAALLLLLSLYPLTLTKLTLFAPFWLLFLAALSSLLKPRTAVLLSLLLPMLAGVLLTVPVAAGAFAYDRIMNVFGAINFRMVAYPSVALDVYNDFFSRHEYTHFCQIQLLKPFMSCPYNEYLSVVMAKAYDLGNLNASLFATEGVASVGPILAPLAALACGLVISLGNRLSAGLPARFILLSAGLFPQVLLNVPLATTLLTNGAALLFLLWYVTPRAMFEKAADKA